MCVVVYKDSMGRWKADEEGCEYRNTTTQSLFIYDRDVFGHYIYKKVRFQDHEKTFEQQFPMDLPHQLAVYVRHEGDPMLRAMHISEA